MKKRLLKLLFSSFFLLLFFFSLTLTNKAFALGACDSSIGEFCSYSSCNNYNSPNNTCSMPMSCCNAADDACAIFPAYRGNTCAYNGAPYLYNCTANGVASRQYCNGYGCHINSGTYDTCDAPPPPCAAPNSCSYGSCTYGNATGDCGNINLQCCKPAPPTPTPAPCTSPKCLLICLFRRSCLGKLSRH